MPPVALFLFDRPQTTARVFDAVRRARPDRLFLFADGPHPGVTDDAGAVAAARATVERVDWPCEVMRDYAEANLGVGRRVSSGLDRLFAEVEEAIVLEDDTLPSDGFFPFCAELLARHRDDPEVMMLSGTNDLVTWRADRQDYHFSLYGRVWGWATWRRAWRHYDFTLTAADDPETRRRIADRLGDEEQMAHRLEVAERVRSGRVDTWDYQWSWAILGNGGRTAVPAVNLVSNLGFGAGARHTAGADPVRGHLPCGRLGSPLRPPASREPDRAYDREAFLRWTGRPSRESLLHQAEALLDAGRPLQAWVFFQQLGRTWPDSADVFYGAARAAHALGRDGPARAAADRALALAPRHEAAARLRRMLAGGAGP